ncbi:unnamed protein product [Acanthosepion pharaonis]|uniref:Uncharacterized protein n=1 Tax=Acanthosepion pharaonis TaxID=158019 RepID=A0A812D1F2_ACAPH|nr:unnamed protein product [Sepia pharaonis]
MFSLIYVYFSTLFPAFKPSVFPLYFFLSLYPIHFLGFFLSFSLSLRISFFPSHSTPITHFGFLLFHFFPSLSFYHFFLILSPTENSFLSFQSPLANNFGFSLISLFSSSFFVLLFLHTSIYFFFSSHSAKMILRTHFIPPLSPPSNYLGFFLISLFPLSFFLLLLLLLTPFRELILFLLSPPSNYLGFFLISSFSPLFLFITFYSYSPPLENSFYSSSLPPSN